MTKHQKAGLFVLAYMTSFLMLAITLWAAGVYTAGEAVQLMAVATLSVIFGVALGYWSATFWNWRRRR